MYKLYNKIRAYLIELIIQLNKFKDGFMVVKPCSYCSKKYLFDNSHIAPEALKICEITYICNKCDTKLTKNELGNNFKYEN